MESEGQGTRPPSPVLVDVTVGDEAGDNVDGVK